MEEEAEFEEIMRKTSKIMKERGITPEIIQEEIDKHRKKMASSKNNQTK